MVYISSGFGILVLGYLRSGASLMCVVRSQKFPWLFRRQVYALVGVAGMLAANCRVPLTSVLLLFELTRDYALILPTLAAVGLSFWAVQYCLRGLAAVAAYTPDFDGARPGTPNAPQRSHNERHVVLCSLYYKSQHFVNVHRVFLSLI